MIHIASQKDFVLLERGAAPPWRNFKLVKAGDGRKHNWWLAWNGERMADSRDRKILAEHYPEIERWVVSVLKVTGNGNGPVATLESGNP